MPGLRRLRRWREKHLSLFHPEYEANGPAVKNRKPAFLDVARFAAAVAGNRESRPQHARP